MRVLRVHGGKPKYFHAVIGGNFRIDELQAAVLRVKLKYLDGWTEARQRNARFYDRAFAQQVAAPASRRRRLRRGAADTSTTSMWCAWSAATRCGNSSPKRQIGTEIYYPVPLHLQECFSYLGYRRGDFPRIRAGRRGVAGAARSTRSSPKHSSRRWSGASQNFTPR